ncbi:MAG TPA: RidA family protein [Candidatus Acidoferrales bacterium]|nr:RidA family protein [Candidatus Acidoferrales bacterium]
MNAREHEIVTAPGLALPVGYAHAVIAAPGRTVYLGGQTAQEADGIIRSRTIVEQFGVAADNMLAALRAAGGEPQHLVSLLVYVTDVVAYRLVTGALADVWRARFGRHYPAVALIGVTELFDPAARIELVGVAVVP